MKKKLQNTILALIGLLALSAVINQNLNAADQIFTKNEVSLQLFGQWNEETKAVTTVAPIPQNGEASHNVGTISLTALKDINRYSAGAGLEIFPLNRYLGVRASTAFYNGEGQFIHNLSGHGILRLPLEVIRTSPYILGGVTYDFNAHNPMYDVGAGAEIRLFKSWGVFGEAGVQFKDNIKTRDHAFAKLGLVLKF